MGYIFAENTGLKSILEGLSYLSEEMERVAQLILTGREAEVYELLMMMEESLASKDIYIRKMKSVMETAQYEKQLSNIRASIKRVREQIGQGRQPEAADAAKYELGPFLRELAEEAYFWGVVHPDEEKMRTYYADEFAENHANRRAKSCEISIVIPAYNKVHYTKLCVSSVLERTDFEELDCELILVNHGSTDETGEYFRSLPVPERVRKKVVCFQENVRMLMFSAAMRAAEGRYMVLVNNDTIVTKGWLEVLHTCLKQSEKAVCAVPVTPNTTNLQFTPEYLELMRSKERMRQLVNRPDPLKWDRRARLMPVIAIYDVEKVNQIGFADRYFQTMEFWDDDFSLRARRAGLEQILCRDGYCYHFGSVTGKEAQIKENTLELGSQLFFHKHGLRAWETGCCYHYFAMDLLDTHWRPEGSRPVVLGVDCGYGDSLLQIHNRFRKKEKEIRLYHLSANPDFAADSTSWCEGFCALAEGEEMEAALITAFSGTEFDCLFIERKLNEYHSWKGLVKSAAGRLKKGGCLLLAMQNPYSAELFSSLAKGALPQDAEELHLIAPGRVTDYMKGHFSFVQPVRVLSQSGKKQVKPEELSDELLEAATDYYLYLCTK